MQENDTDVLLKDAQLSRKNEMSGGQLKMLLVPYVLNGIIKTNIFVLGSGVY